ncbi:MAG: Npt1/Npt2 family nucleotide transporter [Thermodesulfobacteriota bacterium]|nr:Npt1/Npt2 family nucleotide transporter [Thermodesulfobacteriota bacterium]
MNWIKRLVDEFLAATRENRGIFLPIFCCFFLVLFSYSFLRPLCQALYLTAMGSAKLPQVWIISAAAMAVVVWIYNRSISSTRPLSLYIVSNVIAIGFFLVFYFYFSVKNKAFSTMAYIVKDIYVVILIEQLWSFCNANFSVNRAKTVYGFLAGGCSIGGIVASVMTAKLAPILGSNNLIFIGSSSLLAGIFLFAYACRRSSHAQRSEGNREAKAVPPIEIPEGRGDTGGEQGISNDDKAFGGLGLVFKSKYLVLICLMLMLSQFVTALIDLQFNQILESEVTKLDLRTAYFGKFFAVTNMVSLIFQFVISAPMLHFLGLYLTLILVPAIMGLGSFGFFFATTMVVIFATKTANKSLTYSIFRSAKEILYIPLSLVEKYKGKAVIDMFIYRFSKAAIALVIIGLQTAMVVTAIRINYIVLALIIIWIFIVPILIREYNKRII